MKSILEKIDLKTLLIIGLIVVILFMRMCEGGSEGNKKIVKIDGKKSRAVVLATQPR